MRRLRLTAFESRPWAVALVAAAGITLLVPSAAALLLPPELLDSVIALGEWRLRLSLAGLFVVSAVVARTVFLRRRVFYEELDDRVARLPTAVPNGNAPRDIPPEDAPAPAARSYLR
jgi:hypothetical protein